mgnify:FL=1
MVPVMYWSRNMKSSDSTSTVPSLAMLPTQLRAKVKKAICPVDFIVKFVQIYGTLPTIPSTVLELEMIIR